MSDCEGQFKGLGGKWTIHIWYSVLANTGAIVLNQKTLIYPTLCVDVDVLIVTCVGNLYTYNPYMKQALH